MKTLNDKDAHRADFIFKASVLTTKLAKAEADRDKAQDLLRGAEALILGFQEEVLRLKTKLEPIRRVVEGLTDPEATAAEFHRVYEDRAPDFGYETRTDTRFPWKDVPKNNRNLMTATVDEVVSSKLREALEGTDE